MNQDRFQTAGLVVAAGLVFLLSSLRPEIHIWRYWPLLLVLWGLSEMVSATWRRSQ